MLRTKRNVDRTLGIIVLIVSVPILILCFIGINGQERAYSFREFQTEIIIYEDKQCVVSEHFYVENPYSVDVKRYLQFCNSIKKPDGTRGRYHLAISDLEYMAPPGKGQGRVGTALNMWLLPQTDPDTGKGECRLTYTARLSSDYEQDDNQLFFNITGNKHRISIFGAEFSIEMPSAVSEENIQFCLIQKNGMLEPVKLDFNIKNNVISGKFPGELKSGTGIGVIMELEDGYFKIKERNDGRLYRLTAMVLLVFASCVIVWYLFGKDKYVLVDTVEFKPPLGMNALEMGYFYDGSLTKESTISMFYTLAGKGYINIMKRRDARNFKPTFAFSKIRDYDGDNPLEKYFMDCIFAKGMLVYSEELVLGSAEFGGGLQSFYVNAGKYLAKEAPVYKKGCRWFILFVLAGMIADYFMTFIVTGENYLVDERYFRTWQGIEAVCLAGLIGFGIYFFKVRRKRWFNAIFYFSFSFVILYFSWLPELIFDTAHMILYLTGMITLLAELWLACHFKRRTKRAMEIVGKVAGYKKFLVHVESNRIDTLFETNKFQYYETVASAYALKVNWKWFKDIENILIPLKAEDEVF